MCVCVCRCSYIKTRHPVTRQDTVQCDQSPNLEGRGIGPFCGPPQEGYNVDMGERSGRSRCTAAHSCVTYCLVILAQGPRHAIHKQARWGGWSQLCLGRERADHARGSRRVRKPACTLLTRAPQPSPKPTRESTLLTHPECATSGCSDASSEYPRVVWSRRSCCSSGDGERRRLPGDGPSCNARVAADKRERRTRKRTARRWLRRTRRRIDLWCVALLRALRRCLAVSRCGRLERETCSSDRAGELARDC